MRTPDAIGPMMPDKLPMPFWTPIHVPAALGPANICPTAYRLVGMQATATPAAHKRTPIIVTLPVSGMARIAAPAPSCPTISKARRIDASDRPDLVQRSDHHPTASDAAPCTA